GLQAAPVGATLGSPPGWPIVFGFESDEAEAASPDSAGGEGLEELLGGRGGRLASCGVERGPAALISDRDIGRTIQPVIDGHEAPASVLGARIDAERFFVPAHGLLRIRLLALPADAHEVAEQATTKALDHRSRLGELVLALVEKCASVEIGSSAYELWMTGPRLRTSKQPVDGPDVDPAEPAVQAQPPLLPEDGLLATQKAAQPVQRTRQRHTSRVTVRLGPQRVH